MVQRRGRAAACEACPSAARPRARACHAAAAAQRTTPPLTPGGYSRSARGHGAVGEAAPGGGGGASSRGKPSLASQGRVHAGVIFAVAFLRGVGAAARRAARLEGKGEGLGLRDRLARRGAATRAALRRVVCCRRARSVDLFLARHFRALTNSALKRAHVRVAPLLALLASQSTRRLLGSQRRLPSSPWELTPARAGRRGETRRKRGSLQPASERSRSLYFTIQVGNKKSK